MKALTLTLSQFVRMILRLSRTGSIGLVANCRSIVWTILGRYFAMRSSQGQTSKAQIGLIMLVELDRAIISAVTRRWCLWWRGCSLAWSHLASCPGLVHTPGARSLNSLACASKLRRSQPLDQFGKSPLSLSLLQSSPSVFPPPTLLCFKSTFFGLSGQSPTLIIPLLFFAAFLLLRLFTYTLYSTNTLAQPTSLHPFSWFFVPRRLAQKTAVVLGKTLEKLANTIYSYFRNLYLEVAGISRFAFDLKILVYMLRSLNFIQEFVYIKHSSVRPSTFDT
jgi:hypothetical protein